MIDFLIDFAKTGNADKLAKFVSFLDITLLFYAALILTNNIGYDLKLSNMTIQELITNFFTPEAFFFIVLLCVMIFMFYMVLPLLITNFLYGIIKSIYYLIMIVIFIIPKIYLRIFKNQNLLIDDSFESILLKKKYIAKDEKGNIIETIKTKDLISVYDDICGDNKIEKFYTKIFTILFLIMIISISLRANVFIIYVCSIISLIPLTFACLFYIFYEKKEEIAGIIEKLNINKTNKVSQKG